MTTAEFLAAIVARLDSAEIPHMIAGSVASSHHGEPRSTQAVDLVIDPAPEQFTRFLDGLDPSRFYVNDAVAALASRSMFNVIEPSTGFNADVVIRKDRPFSASEHERLAERSYSSVRDRTTIFMSESGSRTTRRIETELT